MSKPRPRKVHKVLRTILIVGEGYAEEELLTYIKQKHHARRAGFSVKIGNARGKGAAGVIEYAIRQRKQMDYDLVAVLFDTDTDWNQETRQRGMDYGLQLFPCDPCLEAELIRLHLSEVMGNTSQMKRLFMDRYGSDADKIDHIKHFSAEVFEDAMASGLLLGGIVRLIKTGDF